MLDNKLLTEGYKIRTSDYNVPIGLDYENVEPFSIKLSNLGALGLCGKEGKGHYNFISNILCSLNDNRFENPVNTCIIDDVTQKYKPLANLEIVNTYSIKSADVIDIINSWHDVLSERYDSLYSENKLDDSLLLLIINSSDAIKKITEDMDCMDNYRDIVSQYKSLNVAIIFANYNNQTVSYDSPEPIQMIKRERHLLYFDELDNLKVFDVPYEIMRLYKKKPQLGDAFYISDNEVHKLKMVKSNV